MTTLQDAKLALLKAKHEEAERGGGLDKIDKHHKAGKLTARERIAILLDEDTWVNIPVLLRFLTQIAPAIDRDGRLLAGHRWISGAFNGGAGIVLSANAFAAISNALYGVCGYVDTNDNTITACAATLGGFVLVHSGLFSWYPASVGSYRDYAEMVTVHTVKSPVLMHALTREIARYCDGLGLSCEVRNNDTLVAAGPL